MGDEGRRHTTYTGMLQEHADATPASLRLPQPLGSLAAHLLVGLGLVVLLALVLGSRGLAVLGSVHGLGVELRLGGFVTAHGGEEEEGLVVGCCGGWGGGGGEWLRLWVGTGLGDWVGREHVGWGAEMDSCGVHHNKERRRRARREQVVCVCMYVCAWADGDWGRRDTKGCQCKPRRGREREEEHKTHSTNSGGGRARGGRGGMRFGEGRE